MKDLKIDGRAVGPGHPAFVIAEAGINHGGDLATALRMVEAAAEAGACAIKFQTYVTEKRVPAGHELFDLLKGCELDEKAHWEIQGVCRDRGIVFMSTAFDEESVELLAKMDVPVIKVASFDIVNRRLLRAVAATRIPAIISTGMAVTEEIDRGVGIFQAEGVPCALLHCISAYPAEERDLNLRQMTTLAEWFGCPVGFSDHTIGTRAAVYAVLAGASLVEKHFTLDREQEGPDHRLSADPAGLREMIAGIREAEVILGSREVIRHPTEEGTLPFRRETD
jgi:sialic acid synthase SpsE